MDGFFFLNHFKIIYFFYYEHKLVNICNIIQNLTNKPEALAKLCLSHVSSVPYLHGESGSLLVVVVQYVGHEGGVVGQPLTHAQGDGLTGEQTVAPCRGVHRDGNARRQHGHRKHPQETHDW